VDVTAQALRYFVALSEEGHFGRAATRLHVTTPSLSEQIARLEKRFKADLFVRSPRGAELTDAGRELLALARVVVDAHDAVSGWAALRQVPQGGTVRVGIFAAAAATLRVRVHEVLADRHPELVVATRRIGVDEALGMLRESRIDVAYVPEPLPGDGRGVRSASVTRQRRMLVVPADHPFATRADVGIEETNDATFIPIAAGDPASVDWWLVDPRADGSHPRHGPTAADFEAMLDLCAAGRGLGMAASFAADHYARPGIRFVPLRDVPEARTALCWRADERDPVVLTYVTTARRTTEVTDALSPRGAP
jgi:DNA-binding transcriptional LysR family regulator